jgi:hypothetical protein
MSRRASIFDPMRAMTSEGGPTKITPACSHASANGAVGRRDVRRLSIGVREHGDGLDLELAARADDAEGDFAAVGDQETFDHELQEGFRFSRNALSPS